MPGTAPGDRPSPEPRKRRLGRPPTLDRDAALVAARDVIAKRGFDRTRYADVAEAASVPVTTLQHAFGSLQAMLLESVQRSTASEIAVLRERGNDESRSPWERLSDFAFDAIQGHDGVDTWPVWLDLWRLAGRDAEIGARAGVVYAQWWNYVAELIELGTASGDFTSAIARDRPYDAAQACVSVIDGLASALILRADGPDHARVRVVAVDAIASMLGYDAAAHQPSYALAFERSTDDAGISVDGPVPAAEPLSSEGPLPGSVSASVGLPPTQTA
ncbi:MAG: TetR/AcrR family transcriptional regulator [Solirubrobacteraceae bacterium]|nr:TetR/AcrR family transcriptional regulator [Solirubrobacteraceae bacterium]